MASSFLRGPKQDFALRQKENIFHLVSCLVFFSLGVSFFVNIEEKVKS